MLIPLPEKGSDQVTGEWLPIRYRDFYDVPRLIAVQMADRTYLLDCRFDDDLDDYPDTYQIYVLESLDALQDADWSNLADQGRWIGAVEVDAIRFDRSCRAAIHRDSLQAIPVLSRSHLHDQCASSRRATAFTVPLVKLLTADTLMGLGPSKDPQSAQEVPESWRPVVRRIVQTFAQGSYEIPTELSFVAPVSPSTAEQIREYVADYGETLIDLPDEAWRTSVCQWMETHWDTLVDLWTAESGRSDMVLAVRVFDVNGVYRFQIQSVYVP